MIVPPLAIVAGGGRLPGELAAAVRATGREIRLFAIRGEADADIAAAADHVMGRGEIGHLARGCRAAGCRQMVMVGGIRRRRLPYLSELDWTGLGILLGSLRLLRGGDDSVLRRVGRILEAKVGVELVGIADVAPGLLAPSGPLTATGPDAESQRDIAVGFDAAGELGARDIGQGVVTGDGQVRAREDRRGTDAMLGDLATARNQGGVLVKRMKPQQDRRFDLPAIGPETVVNAARAGLTGIAVEAGAAIIISRSEVITTADRLGLFVWGVEQTGGTAT